MRNKLNRLLSENPELELRILVSTNVDRDYAHVPQYIESVEISDYFQSGEELNWILYTDIEDYIYDYCEDEKDIDNPEIRKILQKNMKKVILVTLREV